MMARPRIAIPVPHSGDREYAERALPQYEAAVRGAGGIRCASNWISRPRKSEHLSLIHI